MKPLVNQQAVLGNYVIGIILIFLLFAVADSQPLILTASTPIGSKPVAWVAGSENRAGVSVCYLGHTWCTVCDDIPKCLNEQRESIPFHEWCSLLRSLPSMNVSEQSRAAAVFEICGRHGL